MTTRPKPVFPFQTIAFLLSVAFLGSGCVAFNVGEPETFTHVETIRELSAEPTRVVVLSGTARLENRGLTVGVGLDADVNETFNVQSHTQTIVARKQKRLAIGLFPGAAEVFCMPEGALQSGLFAIEAGWDNSPPYHLIYEGEPPNETLSYILAFPYYTVGSFGIIPALATLQTLLFEPFSGWSCSHDFFDGEEIKCGHIPKTGAPYWDVSKSTKLQTLNRFPEDVRKQIGVLTCFDGVSYHGTQFTRSSMNVGHWGLVGCHKYIALFIDPVKYGYKSLAGEETKKRTNVSVSGPYIIEFSIPELGHNDWKRISSSDTRATFALPAVERDCTVEAVVSFREDNTANGLDASGFTRQALAKAAGRQWRFDVALKGTGNRPPPPPPPSPPEKLYDGITITPLDEGKYLVKVTVRDTSKTFTVLHLIKAEVQRLAREDFRSRHPGEPAQFVREHMRYETEDNGRILAFTGWVFSVRPVEDENNRHHYDPDSRRGCVRLRVTGGIPAAEAERWAHENIGEIVKYKNVVLEPGQAPPPGARYRSLGESFENGVLTVEFEALQ